eukprot:898400-Amphidinium_carterae.5
MVKEMDNLRELKVLTDIDVKSLKTVERRVISERPGSDGTTDLKARFVARGNPTHVITQVATQAAFLNAHVDVTEVIHVKPLREIYSSSEDQSKVWRLTKALCGLKTSPKMWQKHLVKVLLDQFKMSQLKSDACVFKNQSETLFILSFVDDQRIIGEESEVSAFITNISKKDSQKCMKCMDSRNQTQCQLLPSLLESRVQLFPRQGMSHYTSQITQDSELQYVSFSGWQQSDQTVSMQSRNSAGSSPTSKDESAAKHLIRYPRDWAGCPVSRKSTIGVICQLWSASIVHYSRTQAIVAQSSVETELYALTSAADNLIHLQFVITEMGIVKSVEGVKLHLHTDSASGKAMVSKLACQRSQSTLSSAISTCK